jgi:hypothetical protein
MNWRIAAAAVAAAVLAGACSEPQQEGQLPPPTPGDERFMDAVQPDTQRVPIPESREPAPQPAPQPAPP